MKFVDMTNYDNHTFFPSDATSFNKNFSNN